MEATAGLTRRTRSEMEGRVASAAGGGKTATAGAAGRGRNALAVEAGAGRLNVEASGVGSDSEEQARRAKARTGAHTAHASRTKTLADVLRRHDPKANTQQTLPQKPEPRLSLRLADVCRVAGRYQGPQ